MPRLPTDYKKGLIYKIVCNDITTKDTYVGSTTDFTRRKSGHKSKCNNPNNPFYDLKVYKFIRENNGWDNWSMILVENFSCESKLELKKRERYWIDTLESKLNCNIPSRTRKQWRVENIDKINEREKQWRVKNIDKIKERDKEYRVKNADKLKEYRVKNADKLKEKIECECGAVVNKSSLAPHRKTDKHFQKLELKNVL